MSQNFAPGVFEGPGGVKVHTPDPRSYFKADGRTTVIPVADRNGRSLGFDPTKAGPVILEPTPGAASQTVIDLAAMGRNLTKDDAQEVAATAFSPSEALEKMARLVGAARTVTQGQTARGRGAQAAPLPDPEIAPMNPGLAPLDDGLPLQTADFPVPYASPYPTPSTVPALLDPVLAPAPAAQYQAPAHAPAYPPQPPAYPYPAPGQLEREIADLKAMLGRMGGPPAPPAAPVVARPWEEAVKASPPSTAEQFGMDFLGVSEPSRPKVNVFVDLGPAGKLEFYYHAVSVCDQALLLIYDSRYEGGTRWEPARDIENLLKIAVPSKDVRAVYRYFGVRAMIGVLDVVVLFKEGDLEG